MKPDRGHSPTRRVPQRTCVGCRQVRPKREMLRLVRVADGRVEVDPTGKKPGRGAYLCGSSACWEAGLKKGRLEHVLRTTLTGGDREELARRGRDLVQGVSRW